MPAYILVSYDIVDADALLSDYVPGVMPLLERHGAEVLVADSGAKALEGANRGMHVVLRFPSEQAALDWYNDPAYAPVRKIRLDASTNGSLVLARAFGEAAG